MSNPDFDLEQRLRFKKADKKACLAAIRGEAIPFGLGDALHRIAVTRGLRHHVGYGAELRGALPEFTRALNAQDIMNDIIPEIQSVEETPYCIWYPLTASESTYRELVRRYPAMAYHVGRACAVAGYLELYQELDILPDVHIAEEARECGNLEIFNAIMSQPMRYSIMNDYTLEVDPTNRQQAFLNGDTAVRWTLDFKIELPMFDPAKERWREFCEIYWARNVTFNITEDFNVAEEATPTYGPGEPYQEKWLSTRPFAQYLTEPLPADLPFIEKDLLIVMAAYHGNIDRYVRLRRPKMVPNELECCVRGINHNTYFAAWWAKQQSESSYINKAIDARFIMENVLSRAPYRSLPYVIWWPMLARESTYRALSVIQPEDDFPPLVHACIYGGYVELFDELLPKITPYRALLWESETQINQHFRNALLARVEALGMTVETMPYTPEKYRCAAECIRQKLHWHHSGIVLSSMNHNTVGTGWYAPHDWLICDAAEIDTTACVPDEWKIFTEEEGDEWEYHESHSRKLDYKRWPRGFGSSST
jgi:hypothetical protein